MATTAKRLREWAESPDRKAGDTTVYFINSTGRMSAGDIGGPVFREAGKLEQEGKVMLFQRRQRENTRRPMGVLHYEARIPSKAAKRIMTKLDERMKRVPAGAEMPHPAIKRIDWHTEHPFPGGTGYAEV